MIELLNIVKTQWSQSSTQMLSHSEIIRSVHAVFVLALTLVNGFSGPGKRFPGIPLKHLIGAIIIPLRKKRGI